MESALRDGLSFCVSSGQPVFLDLPGDRYFCLAPDAGAAFLAFAAGGECGDEIARLGILAAKGGPIAPASAPTLDRSLLEVSAGKRRVASLPRAVWRSAHAAAELRWRGLAHAVDHVRRRKARLRQTRPRTDAAHIAQAHDALALLTASLDQCLWRSIAAAHHLIDAGYAPQLVLGVHLRPFKAHCWVQLEGTLVNDRFETVRNFTPILVV